MQNEACHRHADKHDRGQREGDDDVARHGKGIREEADQVRKQDEHEQREDEGEEALGVMSGAVAHHVGDELIDHLDGGLHPARHHGARAHGEKGEGKNADDGHDHPQAGIGEGCVKSTNMDRDDRLHDELMQRIDGKTPARMFCP